MPPASAPAGPTEPAPKGLTYAGSGVDVEEEERNIKALVGALGYARSGTGIGTPIDMPGGYAGMVRFGDKALVLCADGVGSKVEIARALGRYDTVGIDCMAMNVNDALCVGAEPIAFVDYLAVDRHSESFAAQIGAGLARAAEMADVTIVGGETATLPGIVKGFDLAGTCLAWVDQDRIIDGAKVRNGDAIIGVPSFGLHSNGFTLVRRLVEQEDLSYTDPFPEVNLENHTLGEVLLEPTRIYVRAMRALFAAEGIDIHGLSHVTGGGLMNLPRIAKGHRYVVEEPLHPQAVFEWIQSAGRVATREMYKTFNMGMGFAIVLPEDQAKDALAVLEPHLGDGPSLVSGNAGEGARVIGHVEAGEGCLLAPFDEVYGSKTG